MKHKERASSSAASSSEEQEDMYYEEHHEQMQTPTDNSDESDSNIPLEPGMTVACYVPSYVDEEPQIGSIISIPDETDEVLVEWMSGTYSEPWTVCRIKEKGIYTTWKEKISTSMVLFPIELSQSRRISATLKKKLQLKYAQIRDKK